MHIGSHLGTHLGSQLGASTAPDNIDASVIVQLADATISATAVVAVTASVAQTLADAALSASAAVPIVTVLSAQLADATLSAATAVAVKAQVGVTLADAVLVANAAVGISATLSATLEDATLVASANKIGGFDAHVTVTLGDARLNARATAQDVVRQDMNDALTGAPYGVIPRVTGPTPRSPYEYIAIAAKYRTRPNLWLIESALAYAGAAERIDLINGVRVYRVGFFTLSRFPSDRRGPYMSLPNGKMRFMIDDPSKGVAAVNEWGPV
jgi:hypothetical protein